MGLSILLFILGFVVLNICTRFLISGAKSVAYASNVPKVFGLILVIAISVSIPEFAISINALANGNVDLMIGLILGSCMINTFLILGISSIYKPLKVNNSIIKSALPLYLLCSAVFFVLFHDKEISQASINQITRNDGIVILLFFCIFLYYLISYTSKTMDQSKKKPKYSNGMSILLVTVGIAGIVIGSAFVVATTPYIVDKIGCSEKIFAMTVISLGTSIPEIISAIKLFKKGEQDYLIGNIISSNIFNVCAVFGIPVLIYGSITTSSFSLIDFIVLMGSGLLLFIFAETKKTITKTQGLIMILVFVVYYCWMIMK